MEQLLPSAPDGTAPVVATRGTVTYIRATTATSSTPSSPTITTTAAMSVEAQRTSGHVYPLNPFTMDRLLGKALQYIWEPLVFIIHREFLHHIWLGMAVVREILIVPFFFISNGVMMMMMFIILEVYCPLLQHYVHKYFFKTILMKY